MRFDISPAFESVPLMVILPVEHFLIDHEAGTFI